MESSAPGRSVENRPQAAARLRRRCTCSRAPGSRAARGNRCRWPCRRSARAASARRPTASASRRRRDRSPAPPCASPASARGRCRSSSPMPRVLFLDDDAAERQRILVAQIRLDGDRVGEHADVDAAMLDAEAAVAHLAERVAVVGREDRIRRRRSASRWESPSASPPGSRRARRSPRRSTRRSTPTAAVAVDRRADGRRRAAERDVDAADQLADVDVAVAVAVTGDRRRRGRRQEQQGQQRSNDSHEEPSPQRRRGRGDRRV